MGRWAWGGEIACFSGGCRNLAEWLIMGDHRYTRNQPVCGLHREPAVRLYTQRQSYMLLGRTPTVLPFQDVRERPRRKRTTRPPVGLRRQRAGR